MALSDMETCTPLYLLHLRKMNRALALAGTPEAAERASALTDAWQTAGRASEISCVTLDSMEWDPNFNALFSALPQRKVSKVKTIVFLPGIDRHCCFYVTWGDRLASVPSKPVDDDAASAPTWLHPDLRSSASPGTTLSNYIKALLPYRPGAVGGGAKKYKDVAVVDLPANAAAGGFRPGACNTLCSVMPAEFVVLATGQNLEGCNSLYKFIDPQRALVLVGARVLAGWPAPPWGRVTPGPVPASLEPLANVDADALQSMMTNLFRIDGASPCSYRPRGSLWPALRASFATLIMYYEERYEAEEMPIVQDRLRESWLEAFRPAGPQDSSAAHDALVSWGQAIRLKFDADNLRQTSRVDRPAVDRLVDLTSRLSGEVGDVRQRTEDLDLKMKELGLRFELGVSRVLDVIADLQTPVARSNSTVISSVSDNEALGERQSRRRLRQESSVPAGSPSEQRPWTRPRTTPPGHRSPPTPAPAAAGSPLLQTKTVAGSSRRSPGQAETLSTQAAPSLSSSQATPTSPEPQEQPLLPRETQPPASTASDDDTGPLTAVRRAQATIKGRKAADYYQDYMAAGRNHPPGLPIRQVSKANLLVKWFDAMATARERTFLLPQRPGPPPLSPAAVAMRKGQQRRVAVYLSDLVRRRLVAAWQSYGRGSPSGVKDGKQIMVSTIEEQSKHLKRCKAAVVVSAEAFADFRSDLHTEPPYTTLD